MKKLILTFRIEDIKEYGKKNNRESVVELDYDIQQVIIANKVKIEDVDGSNYSLDKKSCYQLIFTIVDIITEQRDNIIKKIEEKIKIHEIVIEGCC